jgi:hypothetical protein
MEQCRPLIKRKGFRYSQLLSEGIIDRKTHDTMKALKRFRSGENLGEFIDGIKAVNMELGKKLEELGKQKISNSEKIMQMQVGMLEEGFFADFDRPNSSGMVLKLRDVSNIPLIIVAGEVNEGNLKKITEGRVSLNHEAGIDSAVIYATSALQSLSRYLSMWSSVFYEKEYSDEARYSALMDSSIEKIILMIEGGNLEPLDISAREVMEIWANRIILDEYRKILENSEDFDDALLRMANMHIKSALIHEVAHIFEYKSRQGPLTPQMTEIFACLAQAAYLNPGLAFRNLADMRDISIEGDLPGMHNEFEEYGLEAWIWPREDLQDIAGEQLESFCTRVANRHSDEIFGGFDRQYLHLIKESVLMEEHIPLIKQLMHCNEEETGISEDAA